MFRIFILMASRRLKSDRFYTRDFTPEVYTPAGFAWVADNSLRTVLQRHCPALAPLFADVRNVFFPWRAGRPMNSILRAIPAAESTCMRVSDPRSTDRGLSRKDRRLDRQYVSRLVRCSTASWRGRDPARVRLDATRPAPLPSVVLAASAEPVWSAPFRRLARRARGAG